MKTHTQTGYGHQLAADKKRLLSVKGTLEDASLQLGYRSEHVNLRNLINMAIDEAQSLACAAEDRLNSAA